MQRIVEPELMEDEAQARAYAEADFDEPDERFVGAFLGRARLADRARVVDLGCGPGNIALRLARALPQARVWGVDGSVAMLAIAERRGQAEGLDDRLRWCQGRLPQGPLPHGPFHAVVSNSLLHHLHDPAVLWQVVLRLAAPGGLVFVGDLRRPGSEAAARALVEANAAGAPAVLREDFFASLCAAFTVPEVRAQIRDAGIDWLEVEPVGERHLVAWGCLPQVGA